MDTEKQIAPGRIEASLLRRAAPIVKAVLVGFCFVSCHHDVRVSAKDPPRPPFDHSSESTHQDEGDAATFSRTSKCDVSKLGNPYDGGTARPVVPREFCDAHDLNGRIRVQGLLKLWGPITPTILVAGRPLRVYVEAGPCVGVAAVDMEADFVSANGLVDAHFENPHFREVENYDSITCDELHGRSSETR